MSYIRSGYLFYPSVFFSFTIPHSIYSANFLIRVLCTSSFPIQLRHVTPHNPNADFHYIQSPHLSSHVSSLTIMHSLSNLHLNTSNLQQHLIIIPYTFCLFKQFTIYNNIHPHTMFHYLTLIFLSLHTLTNSFASYQNLFIIAVSSANNN